MQRKVSVYEWVLHKTEITLTIEEMAYVLTQAQVDEVVDTIVSLKRNSLPSGYCPYAVFGGGQKCGGKDCTEHQREFWKNYEKKWYNYFNKNKQ